MEARERNETVFIVFLSIASPASTFTWFTNPVFINRNSARTAGTGPAHAFPAIDEPIGKIVSRRVSAWVAEHIPLFEAICVAISAHILAFPLFWCAGWALPWPKSPEILTIIEIDLSHWAEGEGAVTKKVTDIIKSEMHAAK